MEFLIFLSYPNSCRGAYTGKIYGILNLPTIHNSRFDTNSFSDHLKNTSLNNISLLLCKVYIFSEVFEINIYY